MIFSTFAWKKQNKTKQKNQKKHVIFLKIMAKKRRKKAIKKIMGYGDYYFDKW